MQTEQIKKFLEPLDYKVKTFQERNPFTDELRESYGTYRTDNDHVFKTGLSSQYTPIQNMDAFAAISGFADNQEIELVGCGTFKEGAEAWAQINLGKFQVGDNEADTIAKRLTFFLSHNGTSTVKMLLAPFRFFCSNQMGMVDRIVDQHDITSVGITDGIRIPHTASGQDYISKFQDYVELVGGHFNILENRYNQLAATKITQETVAEVMERLYPVNLDAPPRAQTNQKDRQALIAQFVSDGDGDRIAWNTAWNLYNAITKYTTHERSFRNQERAQLIGAARDINLEAYQVINDVVLNGN